MVVRETAPDTMPASGQDRDIASSAANGRTKRPINDSTYRARRSQQQARDAWQRLVGADAERTSRGGVSWL